MKVMVVGGTGTVGRGLVPELLERGHDVTVFCRGETPNPFRDAVQVLQGNRFETETFTERMGEATVDAVIDLVCFSAEHARSDLRAFRDAEHLVYVSSTMVHEGPLEDLPLDESATPHPTHFYGQGKRAAEEIFLDAYRSEGFPVTVVRPNHIWGPGSPVPRQLSTSGGWIHRVLEGKPILVTCGGQVLSNHCHAEDAGVALSGLLGRESTHGEIYNLCGDSMTWYEYHDTVAKTLGREVEQVDAPVDFLVKAWPEDGELLEKFGRWHRCFSDRKLQRTVSEYEPAVTLSERIPRTVQWMRDRGLLEQPPDRARIEDAIIDTIRGLWLEDDETDAVSWRKLLGRWIPGSGPS